MKAKELLDTLEKVVAEHGDIDVYCDSRYAILDAWYSEEDNSFDMLSTGGISYLDTINKE